MRNTLPYLLSALALLCFLAPAHAQGPADEKPNSGALTEGYLQGLEDNGTIKFVASSADTTPVDLIDSDVLASANRTGRYLQIVNVINLSTSGFICVHAMDWGDTCSTEAAACGSASNPRRIIPPGQARELVFTGEVDLCGVASAAGVNWQAEYIARQAGAR